MYGRSFIWCKMYSWRVMKRERNSRLWATLLSSKWLFSFQIMNLGFRWFADTHQLKTISQSQPSTSSSCALDSTLWVVFLTVKNIENDYLWDYWKSSTSIFLMGYTQSCQEREDQIRSIIFKTIITEARKLSIHIRADHHPSHKVTHMTKSHSGDLWLTAIKMRSALIAEGSCPFHITPTSVAQMQLVCYVCTLSLSPCFLSSGYKKRY